MASTDRPQSGQHEETIMKRLIQKNRQVDLARKAVVSLMTSAYLAVALVPAAHASDTEVYTKKLESPDDLAPTLMMLLDTSGSMDFCMDGTSTCSSEDIRLEVMRSAMKKILFGSAEDNVVAIPGNVRLGFARYNTDANKGGWVRYPARPLDAFVDINPDGTIGSSVTMSAGDAEQVSGTLNLGSVELDLGLGSVGLNFSRVNVPLGASISEAYIEFTANRDSSADPAVWEIQAHDSDNAPVFAVGTNDIDSRTYMAAVASHAVSEKWVKDSVYKVNVAEALSALVTRSGWCGGNNVALRLSRLTGSKEDRYAYSFDADPSKAPRLVVNYTIDPKKTDSCIFAPFRSEAIVVNSAAQGENDIDWLEGDSGNNAVRDSGALNFAKVATGKRNQVAVRFSAFTGNEITRNAVIDSAVITAYAPANVTNVPQLQVAAFDNANPSAFSCSSSTRCAVPTTGLAVGQVWSLPSNRTVKDQPHYVTVTNQVQYLVNLAGWAPGNAMAFMLRSNVNNTSSSAAFRSYESATAAQRMKLVVTGRQRFTDLSKLKTVREDIWQELATLDVTGGTPLGAAYVETMRYMLGMPVFAPLADPRVTTDATMTRYRSPVKASSSCSGNYIFAMTDGEPNNLAQVGTNTKEITGDTCPTEYSSEVAGNAMVENWRCMYAAAEWGMNEGNQVNALIHTSTVLFGRDDGITSKNLFKVAEFGKGQYFEAGDEASLLEALKKTVENVLEKGATVTAPGVAVNQLNRLNNIDQLFYAVFDPESSAAWKGNLKRYRLDIANENIFDAEGLPAVDPDTSFFDKGATSWWSPIIDGNRAAEGGFASVLPHPDDRKMYTYTGNLPSGGGALTKIDVNSASFMSYAKAQTGESNDTRITNLINWYKGYLLTSLSSTQPVDGTTKLRGRVGGALHSRPILVNYGFSGSMEAAATDPDLQDNIIFFSTLEGTLHAVEAKTGVEKFAFIPGEKLSVLPKLFVNPTQEEPEYGMDLTWSVYRKDADADGKPEKVYIYGGMRMGGSNYYALDVTSLSSPKLLFAIKGGEGGFDKMGQTWSQPTIASIRHKDEVKTVLIFGAGYDAQHEKANIVFGSDGVGNAIYMVDAETGDLIWSADSADNGDMQFSIVAQPKTLDVTGDGLVDHIYFGDLGGQVFRVDLDNRVGASSVAVRVKTLAKVGQTDAGASGVDSQRRFYEPPTVALFMDANNRVFAAVAMGSGYRSHPLNEATTDHFYTFFDYDVPRADILTSTSLQPLIGMDDLAKVAPDDTVTVDVAGKKGWYVAFPDTGEKVINTGLIFRNTLVFTSYVPTVVDGDVCTPVIGRTKLYRVSLNQGGLPTAFLVKDNSVQGLGGDPQLVILESASNPDDKSGCDTNGDGTCDEFDNQGGSLSGEGGSCSDIAIVAGTDVEEFEGCVRASLKRTRWTEKFKQE